MRWLKLYLDLLRNLQNFNCPTIFFTNRAQKVSETSSSFVIRRLGFQGSVEDKHLFLLSDFNLSFVSKL